MQVHGHHHFAAVATLAKQFLAVVNYGFFLGACPSLLEHEPEIPKQASQLGEVASSACSRRTDSLK
jgi:hypothetical protein